MTQDKDKKVKKLFSTSSGFKTPSAKGSGGKSGGAKTQSAKKKSSHVKIIPHWNIKVHPRIFYAALILMLSITTVLLAFPMPHTNNLNLRAGDIAGRDIKAKRDLEILDRAATVEKKESVRRSVPTVFDLDDKALTTAREHVGRVFNRGREIYNAPAIGVPVFADPMLVEGPAPIELSDFMDKFHSAFNLKPEQGYFEIIAEAKFSNRIERAVLNLITHLLDRGIISDAGLLNGSSESGITVRHIYSGQEDKIPPPVKLYSLDDARNLVKERASLLRFEFPRPEIRAILAISQSLLRPTLVMNERETEKRREAAVAEVAPVFFKVERGEMIVREGERVGDLAKLKLSEMSRQAIDQRWFPKAIGYMLITGLLLFVCSMVGFRVFNKLKLTDRDLLFLATVMIINLFLTYAAGQIGEAMEHSWSGAGKDFFLYVAPLSIGAMLTTIFLGPLPGIFFGFVGSALSMLIFSGDMTGWIYCLLGAITGVAGVTKVRARNQVIKAGGMVGLVNLLAVLAISQINQSLLTQGALIDSGAGLLSGLLAGILVSGFVPLFEMVFRYTTNIKLLELANLDQPILRELMVQAPGSYHHSVIVGAMVEAAAESIGANPLLSKVSAYYHDLGKMNKPLYFIENQISGENKHEKLAPSMSSLILISHVKEGLDLARKHKLSPEIIDIIQQHHGTSLITYFYNKAKNSRTEDKPEINIDDYRYPGPKPQTREAGLVMLADAVEASSRTLGEPTPARIQGMVQKIINNIFSDGQLDECELTLKDLHLIAKSFNKILTGIFHRRITYPEPAFKDKSANGNQPAKSAKDVSDQRSTVQGERKEDLKRLGMS